MTVTESVNLMDLSRYIHKLNPNFSVGDIYAVLRLEQKAIQVSLDAHQKVSWGKLATFSIVKKEGKGKRWDLKENTLVPRETIEDVKIKKLRGLKKYKKTIV